MEGGFKLLGRHHERSMHLLLPPSWCTVLFHAVISWLCCINWAKAGPGSTVWTPRVLYHSGYILIGMLWLCSEFKTVCSPPHCLTKTKQNKYIYFKHLFQFPVGASWDSMKWGLCVCFLSHGLNTLSLSFCYLQRGLLLKLDESVGFLDICLIG